MRSISVKRRVLASLITFALAGGIAAQAVGIDSRANPRPDSGDVRGTEQPRAAGANGLALGQSDKPPKDKCKTLLGCGDDLVAALDFEAKILDNFWFGQVYETDYRTAVRVPGDVQRIGAFGDSALWTGTYLGAESFRYGVAKKYLKKKNLTDEERLFWEAQKSDAKARVDQMVAKYHMLVNISEKWNHQLQPSATQPGFGGGVINGEKGYLMRACQPVDRPANWNGNPNGWTWSEGELQPPPGMQSPNTSNRRVFGPFTWEDGKQYYCEDGTSRDAYAGTTFGLLTAFDLVSGDDPAMRAQIRDDIVTLVEFAVKYYWNTPRPHGRVSLPVPLPRPPCSFCGHDFENFVSPLFVIVPMARLNMAQAARHVSHAAPGRDDVAKWDAVWAEELASQGPVLAFSMEFDAADAGHSGYYKYNLHHLTGFSLTRLESDPAVRTLFKQAIGVMDRTTGDDINSHFETITFALTGEESRVDAAVQHLRDWRQYRARIDLGGWTTNSLNCGPAIECVPQDQMEVTESTPAGAANVTIPGLSDIQSRFPGQPKPRLRARYPLAVALRPPTDFLWQRPPTQLDGYTSANHQAPGVDYLLPYWMIRYYTEVEEPALSPFPAWVGPAHI